MKLKKRYPNFKKSHFFYDINHNTEPLSINVFVTGCCDIIRRIDLKSFDFIGLIVFATLQHTTNTFSRLIIEVQLYDCNFTYRYLHCSLHTHYYFSNLTRWVGSRREGAPGTTGLHETKAHPRDVIRPIGSSY